MSLLYLRHALVLGAVIVLAGCGATGETATGTTAIPVATAPIAAVTMPATAPAATVAAPAVTNTAPTEPAATDTALDLPLLAAPTSAPTAAVANAAATPAPSLPAAAHAVQRIVIKDIDLDQPTVSVGLDSSQFPIVPKHDVGWYNLSAAPGQGSNIVLWGHVLRFRDSPQIPAPFHRLKELKPGAQIVLYDDSNTAHTYQVTEQVFATPDQVQYILPTGGEQLTLVSCIGDKVETEAGVEMTQRLVTIAKPTN